MLLEIEKQAANLPSLSRLKIYLLEKKLDYVNAFREYLTNPTLFDLVFDWIDDKLQQLEGHSIEADTALKLEIESKLPDLVGISVEKTIQMGEEWFPNSQETFVLGLEKQPLQQYTYLHFFILENERFIEDTINEGFYSKEKVEQATRYKKILIKHIKLMCVHEREKVEDFVKKPYYPIDECMQICKEEELERAVAALHIKGGEFMTAIRKYLEILKRTDLPRLAQELRRQDVPSKELCDSKAPNILAFD